MSSSIHLKTCEEIMRRYGDKELLRSGNWSLEAIADMLIGLHWRLAALQEHLDKKES